MAADAANESGAQVWVPETARRATYMDFSISLNFNFDFFSLLCRDYFEGGVRVCGDAVLRYFWCGFAVIFILTRGIAVSKH